VVSLQCDTLVIVCGVFIHWEADDNKKIFQFNYEATKLAIARAMKNEPTPKEIQEKKATAKHPYSGV
jgi:5,6,7,8-tetrahydromethanopterin hydro-lyase